MKNLEFNTETCPGKNKSNEDYILCRRFAENFFIAILADGMGGLSYGAEAAKIASESILTVILDKIEECFPEDVLRFAFDAADSAIYEKCRDLKCKMGTAVTAALIIDDSLYYAWQGNVRLYKMTDRVLSRLTADHVLTGTEDVFLTRCVNGKGYRESVPVKHEKLKGGDKIYICSDGCYKQMDINRIANQELKFIPNGILEDDASMIEIKM